MITCALMFSVCCLTLIKIRLCLDQWITAVDTVKLTLLTSACLECGQVTRQFSAYVCVSMREGRRADKLNYGVPPQLRQLMGNAVVITVTYFPLLYVCVLFG